jgi:hypothetical protein
MLTKVMTLGCQKRQSQKDATLTNALCQSAKQNGIETATSFYKATA